VNAASKGHKARNPWVEVAPGVRQREETMSMAARSRMIERNIQRDTCGLGHWREPAGCLATLCTITGNVS
jgi:hypothetical protein